LQLLSYKPIKGSRIDDQKEKLAQLKGEDDALEENTIQTPGVGLISSRTTPVC